MAGIVTKPVRMPIMVVNKWSKGFKSLQSDINKTTSKIGKFNSALVKSSALVAQKGQNLQKYGSKMSSVGKNMSLKVTAPLLALGAASIKASMDLQKGMQNVASLGIAEKRIKVLTNDVSRMTEQFGKSTEDITGGLYQVVSAFGDTADTAKILEINAMGAAAGLATTEQAIQLTSAVTKAYGDTSAVAVQNVTDLAFQTVKLGQTTFPELAASIGQVTPLTKELAISQANLFGVMATATGVTGTAAEVSTQLKGVLAGLMSPTKEMAKLYKKLGVEGGKEFIAKQGGIAQSMKKIVEFSKKSKKPLKDFIGSIRGQTIALAMAGPQYDTLIKKTEQMKSSQGAAAKAFAEQMKAPHKQFAQFREMLINVGADLGEIIIPVLIDVMKTLKPMIQSFKESSPATKKLVVALAGIVAAAGPVLLVIGNIVGAVGSLMTTYGALVPVIAKGGLVIAKLGGLMSALPSLINPVTVVIGSFTAGFLGGLVMFQKFFTNIQNSKTAPKWIKNFAQDWLNGLEALKGYFTEFVSWLPSMAETIASVMILPFKGMFEIIQMGMSKVSSMVPDWVKEGFGMDVNSSFDNSETPVSSKEITQMNSENFVTKQILQRQQQDVNFNFANAPAGSTVESKGDDIAMLNMGYAQ